jgi:hypothetical protein
VVVNIHVVGKTNASREAGVRGTAASVMTNEIITKRLVSFPQEIPNNVVHKTRNVIPVFTTARTVSIMSHLNPVNVLSSYFNIHFNINLPSMLRFSA